MSRSCIRAQIVIVTRLQQGSSLCNTLLRGMKDDSGKANEQDSDVFHHDECRKRQDDFSVDALNLVDALRSRGNPFLEAGVDLVNLDGRISNANDVSAICNKGKDQYVQFVNDVIVTRNTSLDSPIKNNAFQLFKITKRRKSQQPNVPLLKASISLFGQLYIATTERRGDNCDLDNIMFFALEAHSFPPSLANGNEKMYHSTKSDIIHCIESEAEAVSHGTTKTNTQQQHDWVVQDGGQLVHQLDARGTGTFEQFTQRLFLKHLQVELRKVSRLDIVWDTYRPMSIKGHTRDECVRLKVGPKVRIPGKWSEFLRDSTNNVELFKYLSGEVMQPFHSGGDIYITMSNGTTGGHVGPGEDMTTVCNQEEADTRIILHIIHALNCLFSSILIKTSSSDVIVILIYHLHHFDTISTGATSR